jgi:hypothetical protein
MVAAPPVAEATIVPRSWRLYLVFIVSVRARRQEPLQSAAEERGQTATPRLASAVQNL